MQRPTTLPEKSATGDLQGFSLPLCATIGCWLLLTFCTAPSVHAQPADDAEQPAEVMEAGQSSEEELSSDFQAPPEPPPEMDIEKELMTEQEAEEINRDLRSNRFRNVVRDGELTRAGVRELVEKGIRYHVYQLSRIENRRQLHEIRRQILQLVRTAGSLQNNPENFRRFLLEEITKRAEELLDGNYYVRLQAVFLLSELNLENADPARDVPPVAFTPAAEPLIRVLADESQPRPVQLVAANGLRRISYYGELTTNQKITIAEHLIRELQNKDVHHWYSEVLVETLGSLEQVTDRQQQPFILTTLMDVMTDPDRDWRVRAKAAKALGRAAVNANINLGLISYEVTNLVRQIVDAQMKDPGKPYWGDALMDAYLAFRPANAEERQRDSDAGLAIKVSSPTLQRHRAAVEDAEQQVVAIVQQVVDEGLQLQFTAADLQKLDTWLNQNQPNNKSLTTADVARQ